MVIYCKLCVIVILVFCNFVAFYFYNCLYLRVYSKAVVLWWWLIWQQNRVKQQCIPDYDGYKDNANNCTT